MLGDLLVRVYTHYEVAAHRLGLAQRVGVSKVHHVVAEGRHD